MFVFGCTAAMRHSDLINLKVKDIEYKCGQYFLVYRSIKTGTPVSVKLPQFAIDIFKKYSKKKRAHQKLFLYLSRNNFNNNLNRIAEKAGCTERIGKYKYRNGKIVEQKTQTRNV